MFFVIVIVVVVFVVVDVVLIMVFLLSVDKICFEFMRELLLEYDIKFLILSIFMGDCEEEYGLLIIWWYGYINMLGLFGDYFFDMNLSIDVKCLGVDGYEFKVLLFELVYVCF